MERRLAAGHDRRGRLKRKDFWIGKPRRPLNPTRVPAPTPGVRSGVKASSSSTWVMLLLPRKSPAPQPATVSSASLLAGAQVAGRVESDLKGVQDHPYQMASLNT